MTNNEQKQETPAVAGVSSGTDLITAERRRQIEAEGWTAEHDDRHNDGALAHAAAVYASDRVDIPDVWPWPDEDPKIKDELRNLVRAGALIAAEIDRLQRLPTDDAQASSPASSCWRAATRQGGTG